MRSSYDTDVNDNLSFKAKVAPQLQSCQSTGRDVFALTDWMAAQMINLGWLQELDHANHAQRRRQPARLAQGASVGPRAQVQRPLAERHDGYRIQRGAHRPGDQLRATAHPVTSSRARSPCSRRCATRCSSCCSMQGADPEDFTDDEFTDAIAELQKYVDNGQVRRFTGNDYTDDLKQGNVVGLRGVERRHRGPRRPQVQVAGAGRGHLAVE
ncbi:MAG: hypothetical protein WKF82_09785 [Nocardioidaceae bacterium]